MQFVSSVMCKVTSFDHCSSQNPADFLEMRNTSSQPYLAYCTPLDLPPENEVLSTEQRTTGAATFGCLQIGKVFLTS